MPRGQKYTCTHCGQEYERTALTVKKVTFVEMGAGGKLVRSRVAEWLCPSCTIKDPDWNLPPSTGIPRPRRLNG